MISRLKILGKSYTVEQDPDLMVTEEEAGHIHVFKQLIKVAPNQHPEQLREVVLHEVIHALEGELGIELEERDVQALSAGMFAVLKDNPEFVRWLTDNTL